MAILRTLKRAVSHALQHAVQTDRRVRQGGRSPWARRCLGLAFIAGSLLWFLPVLGIWMMPVGLALLSDDIGWLRRLRRRLHARLLAWSRDRKPRRRRRWQRRRGSRHGGETVN
jgi:hypothetical protein